ncbi:MAG: adenylosuccinate synthetase, partial [Acidobacteriota bacterium]
MANIVLVGTQWGDEGKGKIVDLVTERFDVVARSQGGHNAGHTVIIGGKQYILHLIPSGILHRNKQCVVGNGVIIEPFALLEELRMLEEFSLENRLFISDRCHLIMPYHTAVERAEEERLGDRRIGTTSRGIGPCYEDKIGRRGLRVCDLTDPDRFRRKATQNVAFKNLILEQLYGAEPLDAEQIVDSYLGIADQLLPFVTDTAR